MTASLGGVHVDVTASVEDFGPELRRALSHAAERAAREAEQVLGRAGRRAGEQFADGVRHGADRRLQETSGRFSDEGDRAGRNFVRGFSRRLDGDRGLASVLARSSARLGAGLVAGGFGALATTAAAGGIAALAADLSQVVGVLGLLPAAAAGAGAAISTLVIGFQGIGDAISANTPQEWADALANLAPQARAAAIAVKGLADQAHQLRLSVQDQLFTGLADTISQLGQTYLPILQRGFTGVAGEINRVSQAFAEMLLSSQSIADTDTIFANVRASLSQLVPFAYNFSEALRDIATVGSEFLPGMAGRLSEIGARFADIIAQARESGALEQFFANALDAARNLIGTLVNVGSSIAAIFRAANDSGLNVLGTMREMTGQLAEFLNSASGQESLATFFDAAAEAASGMAPVLREIFELFTNGIMPIFANLWSTQGEEFAKIVDILETMLEIASPAVAEWSTLTKNALATLADVLDPLVHTLLPPLVKLVGNLAHVLEPVLKLISGLVKLLTPLIELAGFVIDVLAELVQLVGDAISGIVEFAGEAVDSLFGSADATDEFIVAMNEFADASRNGFYIAGAAGLKFANELTITNYVMALFGQTAVGAAGSATTAMLDFADQTIGAMGSAVAAVTGGMAEIGAAVNRHLANVGAAGSAAFGQFTQAVARELGSALNIARDVIGEIGSVFRGADFGAAGSAIVNSLAAGMIGSIGAVRNAAQQVVGAIGSWLPSSPAKEGPFSGQGWTPYRGQSLVEGFAAGMLSRLALVTTAASQVAGAADWALTGPRSGGTALVPGGQVSRHVVINQNISVPATDPHALAVMAGAHMGAAASRVMG